VLDRLPDVRDLVMCVDALVARVGRVTAESGTLQSVERLERKLTQLRDSLPAHAFRHQVSRLLEGAEAQVIGLRDATEEQCQARLEQLRQLETFGRSLLSELDAPSRGRRGLRAIQQPRAALEHLLQQLPDLQDLVIARKTAALVADVAPIADEQPLAELHRQHQALRATSDVLPLIDEAAPPVGRAVGETLLDELAQRDTLLRDLEERYGDVASEMEAIREVEEVLGKG
jgi:hypothetical protein